MVSLQGFCWLLYRGGLSSGILLSPIQGWSLIRVVSHKGFYWLQYRGGLLSGWSLTRVLLAPIQGCLEVFIGSCTGVVFHWVSLLHFFFFLLVPTQGWSLIRVVSHGVYWLLHRGGLSLGWSPPSGVLLAPAQGWSLIRVVSQGFYWLLHRGVSHQSGPPSGFLLAPAQGWSPPSGILLAPARGWSFIGVVSHLGHPPSGVLLALVQQWCFTGSSIRVVSHLGFYQLLCRGGFSSGWSLIRGFTGSYTGVAFCQVLLAPVQGWFFTRGFTGACTGMAFHQVLLAPGQGWFFILDYTGSCAWVVSHLGRLSCFFFTGPCVAFLYLQPCKTSVNH